jgi:hypothetical protein
MKGIFVLIFVISFRFISAQRFYNDAQLWFNLYLEKKISKKFAIHLNQQDRWTNNISWFDLGYADVGVTYKITKNIKVLADYVFAQKKRNIGGFQSYHQYYIALILKKDFHRLRFSYRNMFQLQYYDPYTSYEGFVQYFYDRNKFTIKYFASKRFEFYLADELYLPLNNPQVRGFQRSRSFAGLFYNVKKDQQLEFYFMFQAQLQQGNWFKQKNYYDNSPLKHDFVYGIGYSIYF